MKDIEKQHEALVYSWAFALAIGFRELRDASGLAFFKLCAVYLMCGLSAWSLCTAVLEVGRKSNDKPRALVEITLLLGVSVLALLHWK